MRLFLTQLFVSERKQIALMAEEKSPVRISLRLFAINRSEMRISMKNKKAKNTKKSSYIDCYYMNTNEIGSRDLYEAISEVAKNKIEFWEAADVIEIELGEKSSIDIEKLSMFRDGDDKKFLDTHNVNVIYGIKTDSEHREDMEKIFRDVVGKIGGFVCSDSDDFMPIFIR